METFNKTFSFALLTSVLATACAADEDFAIDSEASELTRFDFGPRSTPPVLPEPPVCDELATEIGHGLPIVDVDAVGRWVYAGELSADGTKGAIVRFPREGGAKEMLTEALPLAIEADADVVYWLQARTPDVRMLLAVDTDGGAPRFITYTAAHSLALDGDHAYLLGHNRMERVELATGNVSRVALGTVSVPGLIAVDADAVWFIGAYAEGVDAFYRLDKATVTVEAVAKLALDGAPIRALASDSRQLVAIAALSKEKSMPIILDKSTLSTTKLPTSAWATADAELAGGRLWVSENSKIGALWSMDPADPATLAIDAKLTGHMGQLTSDDECLYLGHTEGSTGYVFSIAL